MKKIAPLLVFFCVVSSASAAFDAFLKFGDIKGESTDKDHKDWIEVSSFSWGANSPSVQGCATNEIRFTTPARVAPLLVRKCQMHERIAELPLDSMNTHHVLQGVVITSCSNNMFVAHFDRCAMHPRAPVRASIMRPAAAASPNAQMLLGNLLEGFTLVGLRPVGTNGLVLTARNTSPSLALHCATGKHFPEGKVILRKAGGGQQEFLKFSMTDIVVSSYQMNGDGSVSIAMRFGGSQGSLAGFQDIH